MRKYDKKNKRNILIIVMISIILIIIFSIFIERIIVTNKVKYIINDGSIVFDLDKNLIAIEEESSLKLKWNNDYYLLYKENQVDLGKQVIIYNEDSGQISLYGKFYEVLKGSKVNITNEETIIKSSVLNNFYKLEDRKYLVIDKTIISSDGSLSTNNYLIIELDKVGNATLSNNKVNLKTLSSTTLITTNYKFDIANEKLYFNDEKEIDLKKIIGSSNTYTKPVNNTVKEEEDTGNTIINNIINTTTIIGDISTKESGSGTSVEEIINNTKRTSIINITPYINYINVDYVVYDPSNQYTDVYIEVKQKNSTEVNTIHLNKDATTYVLTNLYPNTEYNLNFKYSYIDKETNIEKIESFNDIDISTKIPSLDIKVYKITSNKIYYILSLDKDYKLDSLNVVLYSDGTKIDTINYDKDTLDSDSLTSTFTLDELLGENIVLKVEDIVFNSREIDMNVYYKYINPYR